MGPTETTTSAQETDVAFCRKMRRVNGAAVCKIALKHLTFPHHPHPIKGQSSFHSHNNPAYKFQRWEIEGGCFLTSSCLLQILFLLLVFDVLLFLGFITVFYSSPFPSMQPLQHKLGYLDSQRRECNGVRYLPVSLNVSYIESCQHSLRLTLFKQRNRKLIQFMQ